MNLEDEIRELLNAEDGRTIEEMIADDSFDEVTLERAEAPKRGYDHWTVSWDNGITTALTPPKGTKLKAGDRVRLYGGAGLGDQNHGWALNGKVVEWKTPMERVAERLTWLAKHDREKREEFTERREQLDADYASLPLPLKQRIDRFRAESPDFRIDSEWYELFCCTEGAKFAEAARKGVNNGTMAEAERFWTSDELRAKAGGHVWDELPESPEIRWLLWAWALNSEAYDYDYKRQRKVLGGSDGHSGNTFGGAMHLAWRLLEGMEV